MKVFLRALIGSSIVPWTLLPAQMPDGRSAAPTIQHATIAPVGERNSTPLTEPQHVENNSAAMIPSDPQVDALIAAGTKAYDQRDYAGAEKTLLEAISRLDRYRDELVRARVLTILGFVLFSKQDVDGAGNRFGESLALMTAHLPSDSAKPALAAAGLAGVEQARGHADRAKALIAQARERFPPEAATQDLDHLRGTLGLGRAFRAVSLPLAAEPYFRAALQAQEKNPQLLPEEVALLNYELAATLDSEKRNPWLSTDPAPIPPKASEARHYAQLAIDLMTRSHMQENAVLSAAMWIIARDQLERQQWAEATLTVQSALTAARQSHGSSSDVEILDAQLAEVLILQERYPEAIPALQEAVDQLRIDQKSESPSHGPDYLARRLERLGTVQCSAQQCIAGVASIRAALALYQSLPVSEPGVLCQTRLAEALRRSATLAEAEVANADALRLLQTGSLSDEVAARLHQQRGAILQDEHKAAAAVEEYHIASELYLKVHPDVGRLKMVGDAGAAAASYAQGDKSAAQQQAQATVAAYERGSWPLDESYGLAAKTLGLTYLDRGDKTTAVRYLKAAWHVRILELPGGEATIQQGYDLASVLADVKGDAQERAQVVNLLYLMLTDSPTTRPLLRLRVTAAWADILHHRQPSLAGPVEHELEAQCQDSGDREAAAFCAQVRARRPN
jgi:hypothetical protein